MVGMIVEKHFAIQKMIRWLQDFAFSVFVLILPITVFWPVGPALATGILPMYVTPGFYLSDVAAGLIIIAALLALPKSWNFSGVKTLLHNQKVALPLFLLVCLGFLSAPWALSPGLAFYTAARWLLAAGVYLAWQAQDVRIARFVKIFLVGLGIQAVIGILQFLVKSPLGLPGELTLSLDQPNAAAIWTEGMYWLRAYGLTFHPNVLGGFLAIGLIAGLPTLGRPFFRLLWLVIAAGLVVTFSRSAGLAAGVMLLAAVIWILYTRPDLRRVLFLWLGVAAIAAVLGGVLLYQPITARLNIFSSESEYASLSARGELLNLAVDLISEQPLVGIGAGNFPLATLSSQVNDFAHSVHHVPLLLAAEVGAAGGLLWYWLWLAPVLAAGNRLRSGGPWLAALTAAWFAIGLIALWDSYPWALEAGRLLSVSLLAWFVKTISSEQTQ